MDAFSWLVRDHVLFLCLCILTRVTHWKLSVFIKWSNSLCGGVVHTLTGVGAKGWGLGKDFWQKIGKESLVVFAPCHFHSSSLMLWRLMMVWGTNGKQIGLSCATECHRGQRAKDRSHRSAGGLRPEALASLSPLPFLFFPWVTSHAIYSVKQRGLYLKYVLDNNLCLISLTTPGAQAS